MFVVLVFNLHGECFIIFVQVGFVVLVFSCSFVRLFGECLMICVLVCFVVVVFKLPCAECLLICVLTCLILLSCRCWFVPLGILISIPGGDAMNARPVMANPENQKMWKLWDKLCDSLRNMINQHAKSYKQRASLQQKLKGGFWPFVVLSCHQNKAGATGKYILLTVDGNDAPTSLSYNFTTYKISNWNINFEHHLDGRYGAAHANTGL
jgi:hypothetical protein